MKYGCWSASAAVGLRSGFRDSNLNAKFKPSLDRTLGVSKVLELLYFLKSSRNLSGLMVWGFTNSHHGNSVTFGQVSLVGLPMTSHIRTS